MAEMAEIEEENSARLMEKVVEMDMAAMVVEMGRGTMVAAMEAVMVAEMEAMMVARMVARMEAMMVEATEVMMVVRMVEI